MKFKPGTEQEIADRKLWPKAVYPFEITEAAQKGQSTGRQSHASGHSWPAMRCATSMRPPFVR
jgi:hypothetical protein